MKHVMFSHSRMCATHFLELKVIFGKKTLVRLKNDKIAKRSKMIDQSEIDPFRNENSFVQYHVTDHVTPFDTNLFIILEYFFLPLSGHLLKRIPLSPPPLKIKLQFTTY